MNWNIGLNFYSSRLCIFNPSDLEQEEVQAEIESDKYHIYLICKRKKIHFESSEEKDSIGYTTLFYLNDKFEKEYLYYKHSLAELKINEVKDGYYNVDTNLYKGVLVRDYLMINNFAFLVDDILGESVKTPLPSDLEVMYIGQAFGRTETKKIDYRIANHDKIQKIALDILNKSTNEEVLIIGIKVETNDLTTSIVTINSKTERPTLESILQLRDKAAKRITEGQEITVFEASLIKYFQTNLNTEYKETFPSHDFKSYKEIYETDFDYSVMTIDTRPVAVRIYSQQVKERKYIHSQHFPLTTESEKRSLFEYLMEFEESQS
jgi:hypothetical protein